MATKAKNNGGGSKKPAQKPQPPQPGITKHKLTDQDFIDNPALATTLNPETNENFKVGDEVEIPGESNLNNGDQSGAPAPEKPKAQNNKPLAQKKQAKTGEIAEKIREVFEHHPHVLTVWVNAAQTEWYFMEKPGFTPIERNEL